ARGYAPLALSTLGASWCLLRFEEHGRARDRLGYWTWMAVALMSQLVAVQFLLSCLLYSLSVRGLRRGTTVAIAKPHWAPLAFLGLIVAVDVARFQKIGNPPTSPPNVLGDWASFGLGGPNRGAVAMADGGLLAALLLALMLQGPHLASQSRARASWW